MRRAEPRRRSVGAVLVAASSPVRACGVSVGMEERGVQAVAKDSSRIRLCCAVTGRAVNGTAQEDELDVRQDQGVGRAPDQDFVLNMTADEGQA
ncbi:hypothetical protein PR001_g28518 [Phytophthora rubi]|uniref:Uncharacterized protein n=1 Tax=Phytophthora rubi TaxID=129364 RepID=A0A6A3HAS5_9STRA|nr:hypothetical protein PR002_g29663 [Phytophthora rubi]KAE8966085.1 hypothetical protein PR001_g28518 [Phytophthora rubi]